VELGTFPSPDYDTYAYVTGAAIPDGATVGTNDWDPTADSAEYSFTISSTTNTDTGIAGNIGWPDAIAALIVVTPPEIISGAGFTITNTGALSDTFLLTASIPSGTANPIEIWSGGIKVTSVALDSEETADITFKVTNPYQDIPLDVHTITVTIAPLNGSWASIKEYTVIYHTTVALFVKRNGETGTWWTPDGSPDANAKWYPDNQGLDDNIVAAGLTAWYDWQSNDTTLTDADITFTQWGGPYTWVTESIIPASYTLNVAIDPNEGAEPRLATLMLAYDTIQCEISYLQAAP
jgi:hypothetical protein